MSQISAPTCVGLDDNPTACVCVCSFPNSVMVETAVRHGCIILSINLCELKRLAEQRQSLKPSPATELTIASAIAESAMKWVEAHGQLIDGTLLAVQVGAGSKVWS